jgi:hypothetical protein
MLALFDQPPHQAKLGRIRHTEQRRVIGRDRHLAQLTIIGFRVHRIDRRDDGVAGHAAALLALHAQSDDDHAHGSARSPARRADLANMIHRLRN